MKYRIRPIEVEAIQWLGNSPAWRLDIKNWITNGSWQHSAGDVLFITFAGDWRHALRLNRFDWLVRYPGGQLVAFKNDDFEENFYKGPHHED